MLRIRSFKALAALILPLLFIFAAGCAEQKAKDNYKLAEELLKNGSYKDSAAKYAEVITYDKNIPEVEDSYYKLGVIYSKYLNDPNSAIYHLEEMIKKFPQTSRIPEARRDIAVSYLYKLNKPEKAVEQLDLVEKNYPGVAFLDEVIYLKGKAYLAMNDFEKTDKLYENFSTIFPNSKYLEEIEYQRCINKLKAGKNKEAVTLCQSFVSRYPKGPYSSLAMFDLGTAYENLADYKNALDAYKRVGPDYPNQDALKIKIQKLEERLKKKTKAPVTRTPASVKKSRQKTKEDAAKAAKAKKKTAAKKSTKKTTKSTKKTTKKPAPKPKPEAETTTQ